MCAAADGNGLEDEKIDAEIESLDLECDLKVSAIRRRYRRRDEEQMKVHEKTALLLGVPV